MEILKTSQNINALKNIGYKMLDKIEVGKYVLVLVEDQRDSFSSFGLPNKSLLFERKDTDATSPQQQFMKHPTIMDQPIKDTMSKLTDKIKEWKSKYGPIMIASFVDEKTMKYKSILDKLNIPVETKMINWEGMPKPILIA